MKELFILAAHLVTTAAKLAGKGGARSFVADSLLMKQQLVIIRRHQRVSLTPQTSHPFLEHLTGTMRLEYLDQFFSGTLGTWGENLIYSLSTEISTGSTNRWVERHLRMQPVVLPRELQILITVHGSYTATHLYIY